MGAFRTFVALAILPAALLAEPAGAEPVRLDDPAATEAAEPSPAATGAKRPAGPASSAGEDRPVSTGAPLPAVDPRATAERALRVSPGTPRPMASWDAEVLRGEGVPAAGAAAAYTSPVIADAPAAAPAPTYSRTGTPHHDEDLALSQDQKSFVRQTVRFIRSVVQHPATWAVAALAGITAAALSFSSRRRSGGGPDAPPSRPPPVRPPRPQAVVGVRRRPRRKH